MLLEKCRQLNINRVFITCDRNNVGSAEAAIYNGAVLGEEIMEDGGNILQPYRITLSEIHAIRNRFNSPVSQPRCTCGLNDSQAFQPEQQNIYSVHPNWGIDSAFGIPV